MKYSEIVAIIYGSISLCVFIGTSIRCFWETKNLQSLPTHESLVEIKQEKKEETEDIHIDDKEAGVFYTKLYAKKHIKNNNKTAGTVAKTNSFEAEQNQNDNEEIQNEDQRDSNQSIVKYQRQEPKAQMMCHAKYSDNHDDDGLCNDRSKNIMRRHSNRALQIF